ncbi:MAG: Crp/Fnr family transcriptional regulator [Solirubrobacterales bacterium]|nr:Crp/Fnr family transcriptional regulator [Solirubrobacterales bacterium]MBV9366452.1 Crp/Fnr family transcriptional regulator [Solirubrobacterales bacterium]MBV9683933.1 Crp/Fnr family transcriptional regulator [Solirubrobacterales bacterium]MBV9809110.1 Crp/Fnr family transcriptional regulator [Solirubrobacterales bacterium]
MAGLGTCSGEVNGRGRPTLGAVSRILAEDPELSDGLTGPRLEEAVRDCVAGTCGYRAGPWSPPDELGDMRFGIGLLILDGLIVRRVGVAGRFGGELLGDGDLMNPFHPHDMGTSLPRTGKWRVLRDSRMAILDSEFVMRASRYPEVVSALLARALMRSRHIATNMAIVQQPRIDLRLHMLFWELADRWGIVRQDGVHVPLHLTHATLSDLVAARRPTVTKALGELAHRGAVVWTGTDWLLPGAPPSELEDLGSLTIAGLA